MLRILQHMCVCFKNFHSDTEIVPSWLLKLYWLLWSEFNLGLESAAWDAQKAPSLGRMSCMGHVPMLLQNDPRRDESFWHLPSFLRKAITAFSNLCWGASLLLPCAIVALLPKQGKSGKKVIRAGNDHDKGFIFFHFGIFLKHEMIWAGERHELIEMRKSGMEMTKIEEKLKHVCKGGSPKPHLWCCKVAAARVAARHWERWVCSWSWPTCKRGLLQAGGAALGRGFLHEPLAVGRKIPEIWLNVSISSRVSDL